MENGCNLKRLIKMHLPVSSYVINSIAHQGQRFIEGSFMTRNKRWDVLVLMLHLDGTNVRSSFLSAALWDRTFLLKGRL